MTSQHKKIRLALLLWHRRIGAVVALFLLLLSVTGLLLNHSSELELDSQPLHSSWLLDIYGVERPKLTSYQVAGSWYSHLGGHNLYVNQQQSAYCEAPLLGVEQLGDGIVAACGNELLMLMPNGEVIERIDSVFGLPLPLQALAKDSNALRLKAGGGWYQVDTNQLSFTPLNASAGSLLSNQAATLPGNLEQSLVRAFQGEAIDLERLLLDLHSGRLLGLSGVIWTDLVALALIWIAASGVWVWATRPRRH